MRVIGLEEHFVTSDLLDAWRMLAPEFQDLALRPSGEGESAYRLLEVGEERFAAMDEMGLAVQVLSLTAPGVQNLASADAVALQKASNDLLADMVRAYPERLQGFATLATPSPLDAARELERAVTKLGLKGGMLFGRTRERNLDHRDFWPIFETAAALNAPLYLHPQSPLPTVRKAYYGGFGEAIDAAFATHAVGWYYETGVQLLRLILSGVFDQFPKLQVIVGHWGEVVLFYLDKIDELAAIATLKRSVSEYMRSNVFVTPSGLFSQRYLRWTIEVMGVERIMFSTDYPFAFAPQSGARRFLEETHLSEADRVKIASGNWDQLCAGVRH